MIDNIGSWSTKLILDGNWTIYKIIYRWSTLLNGPVSNVQASDNVNDLKANAVLTTYSSTATENAEFQLYGLWPSQVQNMSLDWGQSNSALEGNVTWQYDYAIPISFNGQKTNWYNEEARTSVNVR